MNHREKRMYLIRSLLNEDERYRKYSMPQNDADQKDLLRSLMNVRPAAFISEELARVQDEYLREAIEEKGVTDLADLTPVEDGIYLWQGDITTLRCDAIVNAANSGMTGCYQPLHNCIDNCIHTYAGMQLRKECADMMKRQGHEEPTGEAKLTPAYNLPSKYILHTVGPIVSGRLTKRHEELLASCYRACLNKAAENGLHSVAFCCISTGVFGFPPERAAEIAVATVREWKTENKSDIEVIFNVFSNRSREIYERVLG